MSFFHSTDKINCFLLINEISHSFFSTSYTNRVQIGVKNSNHGKFYTRRRNSHIKNKTTKTSPTTIHHIHKGTTSILSPGIGTGYATESVVCISRHCNAILSRRGNTSNVCDKIPCTTVATLYALSDRSTLIVSVVLLSYFSPIVATSTIVSCSITSLLRCVGTGTYMVRVHDNNKNKDDIATIKQAKRFIISAPPSD